MSGKSNFNSYDNDNRKYTSEVKQNVWKRSYSTHDFYAAVPSGNILADVVKNGTICGVRLQEGELTYEKRIQNNQNHCRYDTRI